MLTVLVVKTGLCEASGIAAASDFFSAGGVLVLESELLLSAAKMLAGSDSSKMSKKVFICGCDFRNADNFRQRFSDEAVRGELVTEPSRHGKMS
jgi:hypothetical protein